MAGIPCRISWVLLVALLIFPLTVQAEDQGPYLQMDLFVDTSGEVFFYGETNSETRKLDPSLGELVFQDGHFSNTSDMLTSKIGRNWTFSLDIMEEYSEVFINVYLPEGGKIYGDPQGGNWSLISVQEEGLVISFLGTVQAGESMTVQYRLDDGSSAGIDMYIMALGSAGIVALVIVSAIIFWPKYKSGLQEQGGLKLEESKLEAIRPTLTERERKIIDIVIEEGGKVSQKKLRHLSDIPKSSLSRITDELQRKNLIEKIPVGQTNEIRLHRNLVEGEGKR